MTLFDNAGSDILRHTLYIVRKSITCIYRTGFFYNDRFTPCALISRQVDDRIAYMRVPNRDYSWDYIELFI